MCRLHLDHIRHLEKTLEQLDAQTGKMMRPFQPAVSLLVTVPGVAALSARAVISEISASPADYFPTAAQLASRTRICPGSHESADRHYSGKRRPGNKHPQPVLAECARAAVRHEGYLRSLYHRHVMRNGGYRSRAARNKAIITVARSILGQVAGARCRAPDPSE